MACICPNFERKHFMTSTLCVIPILYRLPAVVSQQHYQRKTTSQINNDVFQFLRLSWGHRCNMYRRISISSMKSNEGHTYLTANSSLCARHHIQYTQSRLSSAFPFKADSQLSQATLCRLFSPLLRYPVACKVRSSCGCESIHRHHLHHTTTQGKLILNVAKCQWSHSLEQK